MSGERRGFTMPPMPTDRGFRIQLIVTALVAVAVIWVGIQTGDWTGLVLVVPLALLVPIVAKLPSEPPARRQKNAAKPGDPSAATKDKEPRRY